MKENNRKSLLIARSEISQSHNNNEDGSIYKYFDGCESIVRR